MTTSFIALLLLMGLMTTQYPENRYSIEHKLNSEIDIVVGMSSTLRRFSKADLGSDDLIIFKCFRVILSLKKRTIQFSLSFNLYFQRKRAPKLSISNLTTERSVWVFDVTNRRNDFSSFQSYHELVMYLFNSLAKSCALFWK